MGAHRGRVCANLDDVLSNFRFWSRYYRMAPRVFILLGMTVRGPIRNTQPFCRHLAVPACPCMKADTMFKEVIALLPTVCLRLGKYRREIDPECMIFMGLISV